MLFGGIMKEKDFLSFLVDETLKLQTSGEAELSSLELKLRDYELVFLKGEFVPQLQVLRFQTTFGILDIPINWSIFAVETDLKNTKHNLDHLINDENDDDHLLEVLRSVWPEQLEKLLITHAEGFCYVVGLRKGEDSHLHDLLNPTEFLNAA
jgi:hypothetical protein